MRGQCDLESEPSLAPRPRTPLSYHSRSLMKLFDGGAVEIFWRAQRLPSTLGVRVMLVDSLYPGTRGFPRMRKMNSHARTCDRVARQRVIHEQNVHAGVVTRDPGAVSYTHLRA